jgi:hypothetical protein
MNGIEAREDFNNVVDIFQNAFNPRIVKNIQSNQWVPNPAFDIGWDPVSAFRLNQQTLRLEQPLSATSTLYTFPILNNIQNQPTGQTNTEIRLAQQDTFVPASIWVGLGFPTSPTDTTFIPKTYANQFLSANAIQEQAVYNGVLNIMVNNVQYTKNWDLLRHYHINQTQQTAAFGAGSPVDQTDLSIDGWYPMQPFIMMIGSQNIIITVTVPVAPTLVDTNSRLILMMRGVLAQQSTVVN